VHLVPKRRKLGEILVRKGQLSPEQLDDLLRLHKESGTPLGQILIDHDFLTPDALLEVLGEQLGIPHIWLRKGLVDPRIVHVLPREKAQHFSVIPMFRVGETLTLATADPNAIFVFDEVERITGCKVLPVLCRENDISEAINECYRVDVSIDEVMQSMEEASIDLIEAGAEKEISELKELADESPVINVVNTVLIRSIRDGVSDIHIEPQADNCQIRVRIDGVLYEMMSPKMDLHAPLVSRLKVMAGLDIAERRLPQDGRLQVKVDNRVVDLRFSSMPGMLGEKVVLRILDKANAVLDLNQLGFDVNVLDSLKTLLKRPNGLMLTCGPTGSGKTTTLYSALSLLNSPERNIVTIEDPVEYHFPNVNQNQVRDAIGLSFAKFIKHALRQDPDIMMVGEIRDRETADTAVQAALTGHLVLSTLHTNDSPSTITRLLEMDVEPYLISSSLLASLAQRLVRTICPDCRTPYYPPRDIARELGGGEDEQLRIYHGRGCKACYDSGFRGRIGLYELLEMDEVLQRLILENPTVEHIRTYLNSTADRVTLLKAGYQKVLEGVTTYEEVKRVTLVEI